MTGFAPEQKNFIYINLSKFLYNLVDSKFVSINVLPDLDDIRKESTFVRMTYFVREIYIFDLMYFSIRPISLYDPPVHLFKNTCVV